MTWPKRLYEITSAEKKVLEQIYQDFQSWGYTGLIGWVQNLGHKYIERMSHIKSINPKSSEKTMSLEIGCGNGWHFQYAKTHHYVGIDCRYSLLSNARVKFPHFPLLQADAYNLPFADFTFDRVVSIYVFEHLNRLPECLSEIKRVLKPQGELLVGLPAEGGLAYGLGRWFTSKRYFEKRYGIDYMRIVHSEHCNTCLEVIRELSKLFSIQTIRYLPFFIPSVNLAAVSVVRCRWREC